jgi:hypothetical protein
MSYCLAACMDVRTATYHLVEVLLADRSPNKQAMMRGGTRWMHRHMRCENKEHSCLGREGRQAGRHASKALLHECGLRGHMHMPNVRERAADLAVAGLLVATESVASTHAALAPSTISRRSGWPCRLQAWRAGQRTETWHRAHARGWRDRQTGRAWGGGDRAFVQSGTEYDGDR